MRKMMVMMVLCMMCAGVHAAIVTNDCSSNVEFVATSGALDIYDSNGPFSADLSSGGIDGSSFLWFVTGGWDNIGRWDKAGTGLNLVVTTNDTIKYYVQSYWNYSYDPSEPDPENEALYGYKVQLWYAGDAAPVVIDGPRAFHYETWTLQSFTMPKDGTLVAVEWAVSNAYKRFYLDNIEVTGVPEPISIGLFGLSLVGLLRRRT